MKFDGFRDLLFARIGLATLTVEAVTTDPGVALGRRWAPGEDLPGQCMRADGYMATERSRDVHERLNSGVGGFQWNLE